MSWINNGDTGLSIRDKLNALSNKGVVQPITTGASPVTLTEPFADVYVITSGGSNGVENIVLPAYGAYADANVGKRIVFLLKALTPPDNPTLAFTWGTGGAQSVALGTQPFGPVSFTVECEGKYWRPIGWGLASVLGFFSAINPTGFLSHAEGIQTLASGSCAHAEGLNTTASGDNAHAEGTVTTASGLNSHVEGHGAIADGEGSHVEGYYCTARGIYYAHVESGFRFSAVGDAQCMSVKLGGKTTNATPLVLRANVNIVDTPSTDNQVALPDNASYFCEVTVVGKVAGLGDYFMKKFEVVIQRGTGAATTAIPTTTPTSPAVISTYATAGAISGSWDAALSADTTNGALAVTVTGQAATNINWMAEVRTRELML
jgi:hypothetical protein